MQSCSALASVTSADNMCRGGMVCTSATFRFRRLIVAVVLFRCATPPHIGSGCRCHIVHSYIPHQPPHRKLPRCHRYRWHNFFRRSLWRRKTACSFPAGYSRLWRNKRITKSTVSAVHNGCTIPHTTALVYRQSRGIRPDISLRTFHPALVCGRWYHHFLSRPLSAPVTAQSDARSRFRIYSHCRHRICDRRNGVAILPSVAAYACSMRSMGRGIRQMEKKRFQDLGMDIRKHPRSRLDHCGCMPAHILTRGLGLKI